MSEIDALAGRYADAVFRKDREALLALYDPGVVIFDMWDRWSYEGRDAWSGAVTEWFGSLGDDRVTVGFTLVAETIDGDWAFWCATVRYAGVNTAGEELRAMENRMSWALRRRDGEWRVVHEHSSAPADFGTLKVSLVAPL